MTTDGKGNPVSEEPHDSNSTRMTVAEAARALGVSESAVRKRVQRGTLEHEHIPGGRLMVYLDSASISAAGRERPPYGSHENRIERYIRGLEDRIEDLRNELDREREANQDNKRTNAALEERIAELEGSQRAPAEADGRVRRLTPDPSDAAVVQFLITAGASLAAVAVLLVSVSNGQVALAGLAGGLTLLSIGSLLLHWWLFRSGTERRQEESNSVSLTEAPEDVQEKPHGEDSQAVKRKLPLHLDLLVQLVIVLALVFGFVRPFVMEAFWIPSGSMIPTLEIGDRVLVNKFIYRFTEPERGDIVVFESVDNPEEDLIKRVVALPGDEIAERNGKLYVNGKHQREPYTNKNSPDRISFPTTTIPKNHVFVMGDNRANSADSRVFGPLPEQNIEGEAFVRFWPPNRIGLL